MTRRFLSNDPLNGITTWHEYDALTDTTHLIYTGDAEPVLELNKARANDPEVTRHGIKEDFWLYASIPTIVQLKWMIEEGIDIYNPSHGPRISRKLEDPEYRYLKCTTKRHIIKE